MNADHMNVLQSFTSIWASLLSRYWIMKASWGEPWLWTEPTVKHRHKRRRGTTLHDIPSTCALTDAALKMTLLFVFLQRSCSAPPTTALVPQRKKRRSIHVAAATTALLCWNESLMALQWLRVPFLSAAFTKRFGPVGVVAPKLSGLFL